MKFILKYFILFDAIIHRIFLISFLDGSLLVYRNPTDFCILIFLKKTFNFILEYSRQTLFSWAPKSLQMVTAAMKLKDTCSLEENL